ncbi:MAG TPA: hypothetical protein VF290_01110 [Pyrinomonadaceae bacterium]
MRREDKERAVLRRYLLGELPEAERSQLADRYFVDEELFDELLDVENELLGQYARKELSADESKRFSEYLSHLPDGASKLVAAYSLMEAADELREAPATSRWQVLRQWLFVDYHVLRYATVVILIALVGGLVYLSLNQSRRDTGRLSAGSPQPEQKPRDEKVTQTKEPEPSEDRPPTKRPSESRNVALASLTLTLPTRSGGTPDVLTLSPETQTVSLIIPIPQDEGIANYHAVLQTTSGRVILSNVRLRQRPQSQSVSLRLSASQLSNETHKLTLLGTAADGIEVAHDYYFKIVRTQ